MATPEGVRLTNALLSIPDTTYILDSLFMAQWYEDARNANDLIVSQDMMDGNEYWINKVYLDYLEYGIDTLTVGTIDSINELALTCPLVGGTAVHKARTMNSLFHPELDYYDIEICNNAGYYKGGKGIYDDDITFLTGQQIKKTRPVTIVPNPNAGRFTLLCELVQGERGQAVITDMYGRQIKMVLLNADRHAYDLELDAEAPGMYFYRVFINDRQEASGKISVIK